MRHILKTDHDVFQETWDEVKTYEIRLDDRGFKVGDELLLVETERDGDDMKYGALLTYTGRFVLVNVIQKLKGKYGLREYWCILGTEFVMSGDDYNPLDKSWELGG